ncbi:hypothetical protein [Vibrio sp. TRT 29B02]|uniref:hypothetical protein n=1 Tax=Vibrio sp. TRT 29B02 TaxID=3418508 RepID=UPI003CF65A87
MVFSLEKFVALYFEGDISRYAEFCGVNYKSCSRHINDPRMHVEVTPHGIRRFKLEQELPARAYDVRYDHFNPHFIKFSFCGVSYSLLQSGSSYLLKSLELDEGSLPLELVVQQPDSCSFTSFVFRVSANKSPILEVITDVHGSFVILDKPSDYIFWKGGVMVPELKAVDFNEAIRVCLSKGVQLRLNNTLIFDGGVLF